MAYRLGQIGLLTATGGRRLRAVDGYDSLQACKEKFIRWHGKPNFLI